MRSQAPANETAQESLSEAVRLLAGFFVHEATRNRICGAVSSTLGVSPTLMQSYQTKQVILAERNGGPTSSASDSSAACGVPREEWLNGVLGSWVQRVGARVRRPCGFR